jgi:hypothetical protein
MRIFEPVLKNPRELLAGGVAALGDLLGGLGGRLEFWGFVGLEGAPWVTAFGVL